MGDPPQATEPLKDVLHIAIGGAILTAQRLAVVRREVEAEVKRQLGSLIS